MISSFGYWCRTCKVDFGAETYLCQACFGEDEQHRQKHKFGTFEVAFENESDTKDMKEIMNSMWACAECPASKYTSPLLVAS